MHLLKLELALSVLARVLTRIKKLYDYISLEPQSSCKFLSPERVLKDWFGSLAALSKS